jgi:hypothetical protein
MDCGYGHGELYGDHGVWCVGGLEIKALFTCLLGALDSISDPFLGCLQFVVSVYCSSCNCVIKESF